LFSIEYVDEPFQKYCIYQWHRDDQPKIKSGKVKKATFPDLIDYCARIILLVSTSFPSTINVFKGIYLMKHL
jgi:hypothetical protein